MIPIVLLAFRFAEAVKCRVVLQHEVFEEFSVNTRYHLISVRFISVLFISNVIVDLVGKVLHIK